MNRKIEIDKDFFKAKSKNIVKKRNYKTKYFSGTIEKTNKRVLEITTTTIFHYSNNAVPNEKINQFYIAKLIKFINEEFKDWHKVLNAINYKFCFFLDANMNIIEQHYKIVFISKENKSKIYRIYDNQLFIDYKENKFIGASLLKQDLLKIFYNIDIDTELLESSLIIPLIEMQIIS